MERHWIVVAMLAAVMAATAGPLVAKEASDDEQMGRMGRRGGRMGRPDGDRQGMGRIMRVLTEEQRAKSEQILKAAREEIKNLLTDEQKAELQERRRGRRPDLGLTDEQKAKSAEIRKAARRKAKDAKTPEERREIRKQMHEDLKEILTDEQRAKREQFGRGRGGDLGLTDEQKPKVAEIRKAVAAKTAEARKQIRQAREQMDKDLAAVLSEEQMTKLRASRRQKGPQDRWREGGRGRRGRGGPDGPRGRRRGMRGMRGMGGMGGGCPFCGMAWQGESPDGEPLDELK